MDISFRRVAGSHGDGGGGPERLAGSDFTGRDCPYGGGGDVTDPLQNLAAIQGRMEVFRRIVDPRECSREQMEAMSSEIDSALRSIIANGSALLASCKQDLPGSSSCFAMDAKVPINSASVVPPGQALDRVRISEALEIVEIDAVELLVEHVHFCEICGKGFKRDANLRMHMRAHGNQYKTQEALSKPSTATTPESVGTVRFSCPFTGCSRNKRHPNFRPLKSAVCVRNHFKRSHCPKMYACNKCNMKSFSFFADLKSHLKHCGETRWACSCGTTFSQKDKLFAHMALFEGHMPAVAETKEFPVMKEDEPSTVALSGAANGDFVSIHGNRFDRTMSDFFGTEMDLGFSFSGKLDGDDDGEFEQLF